MMIRFRAGLLLTLLLSASPALAGGKSGRFAVEDVGRATCAAFVQAKASKSDAYQRYIGFVEGYVTAANRYEPNTFDLTPWHTSDAYALILEKNCSDTRHAKMNLAMVAQELVAAMRPLRLADYSDMVAVRDGSHKADVYATILKRAQMELARRGLFHAAPDGKFSPETKTALIEFQKTARLDPTGVPDPATLWVLLNP